ncbi:Flp family type IVb pilin [Rhodovibrio sodomensis]|uniref:Flp family type IVb pilin n=1 Tax=Rhodovibrio sodomensis TaxID=1088 RepID=A0ABS1D9V4_9PROT|nr:Flp family type IVb pilin [Rhodovibrio sodomensis]MBK1666799.1 Flp family type IVb pilin [Rhodovibrio sodomensis]
MRNFIKTFARDESGATAIEYALIAALIAVAIVGAATAVGTDISGLFNSVSSELQSATP